MFPRQPNGFRVLETPAVLKWLFDPAPLPHVDIQERPGGFNWGRTEDGPGQNLREEEEEEEEDENESIGAEANDY